MDWLKIIANVTSLVDFWSKWFGKRSDQQTGAKLQQGATDAATLKTISEVNRPVSPTESDSLWLRNAKKYGQPVVTGEADGE